MSAFDSPVDYMKQLKGAFDRWWDDQEYLGGYLYDREFGAFLAGVAEANGQSLHNHPTAGMDMLMSGCPACERGRP